MNEEKTLPLMLASFDKEYSKAGKEWAWQYVFPANNFFVEPHGGRVARHHVSDAAVQKMIKTAMKKAGTAKHASVQTLWHSFATHLLWDISHSLQKPAGYFVLRKKHLKQE